MGFGDFAMGYLVGQSFSGPNHIPDGSAPYSEWSSQAKKDWDKKCDEAYWRAWDKAYKEGTINELKNVQTAGIQTAKVLGTTKERLISAIESGEIKIVSIIEPNVVAEIPTKMIWTDASREEAQRDEYKQYLKEVMDLIGKYQHCVIL